MTGKEGISPMEDAPLAGLTGPAGDLVLVEFKGRRVEPHGNPERLCLSPGELVMVELDRGWDIGRVLLLRPADPGEETGARRILRKPSADEVARWSELRTRDGPALQTVNERVAHFHLPMHLVDAEHQADGNRLTFYFTAEHRVDFRELVRDLAGIFRTRIELRQIGHREAARRLGGLGPCGRELCCGNSLCDFERVTLRMARAQKLVYNPGRLSGLCGRLLCCLTYELTSGAEPGEGDVPVPPHGQCRGCS